MGMNSQLADPAITPCTLLRIGRPLRRLNARRTEGRRITLRNRIGGIREACIYRIGLGVRKGTS